MFLRVVVLRCESAIGVIHLQALAEPDAGHAGVRVALDGQRPPPVVTDDAFLVAFDDLQGVCRQLLEALERDEMDVRGAGQARRRAGRTRRRG